MKIIHVAWTMAVAVTTFASGDVEQPLSRAMTNNEWKDFVDCVQSARTESQHERTKKELLKHMRPSALYQLDTYALARAINRRPLSTEEWVKLAIAQTIVSETRLMLPYKRGNVEKDVDLLPSHERYWRGAIYSAIDSAIDAVINANYVQEAVLSTTIGTSVCNGFAILAALKCLQVAQSDDTISICGGDEHNWVQISNPNEDTIVVDPWSDSPAHYKENSANFCVKTRWSATKADEPQVLQTIAEFESELSENYYQWFEKGLKQTAGLERVQEGLMPPVPEKDEGITQLIHRHVKKLSSSGKWIRHRTMPRTSKIHGVFAQGTRKSQSTTKDLHRELLEKFHVASSDKKIWDYARTLDDLHPSVEF